MKKIPCLFERVHLCLRTGDFLHKQTSSSRYRAIDTVNPHCNWVFQGEGIATIKLDGSPVMLRKGTDDEFRLYQRLQTDKLPPAGSIQCDFRRDVQKAIWWVPATNKWLIEAYKDFAEHFEVIEGTYEAMGPKINGNRHKLDKHTLGIHGGIILAEGKYKRSFAGLKALLQNLSLSTIFNCVTDVEHHFYEGLVFHHPDGRMAKIKRKDFGYE